jgi:hypothetical protein
VPLFIKWEDYLKFKTRDLYFIQIGATEGEGSKNVGSSDPILEYVRPCYWSGADVDVELVPDTFLKLKTNYADMEALNRVMTLNDVVSNKFGYAKINGSGEMAYIVCEVFAEKSQAEGHHAKCGGNCNNKHNLGQIEGSRPFFRS